MRRLRPVSTLPGPHSISCRRAPQQRPHGLRSSAPGWRAGAPASRGCPAGSACSSGIDGADIAVARRPNLDLRQPLLELLRGRAHQARMCRHAHRQQHARACAPRCLASSMRTLHRGSVAGDHHLAGRVEIDRLDHLALRSLARTPPRPRSSSRPSIAAIAPAPSGTACCMIWPRKCTSCTAASNGSASRAHQRGELTEAVAGDHRSVARRPARARSRQVATPATSIAGCVIFGGVEPLGRTLGHQLPQIEAERAARPARSTARTERVARGQRRQHADRLRALAWKYQLRSTFVGDGPSSTAEAKSGADYSGFAAARGSTARRAGHRARRTDAHRAPAADRCTNRLAPLCCS